VDLSFLPAVNAALNALATVLLIVGYRLIEAKRITAHRNCMIAAFATSSLFLVTYVTHYVWRATVIGGTHTAYLGPLPLVYYTILLTHILLAIVVPVLAIALIVLGFRGRYATHRRIARVALPLWLYVSVTGVLIYFMLYHLSVG
jgi:uncharacterized membrane protein YozB (DUF420 family)